MEYGNSKGNGLRKRRRVTVKRYLKWSIYVVLMVVVLTAVMPVRAEAKLNRPEKVKAILGDRTVKLTWKSSKGAKYYRIYQYDMKKNSYRRVQKTTGTNFTFRKLKCGVSYRFKIRAYAVKKGKTLTSSFSKVITVLPKPVVRKPSGLKAKAEKDSISLSWDKAGGATGYSIYQYSESRNKYIKIASTTKRNYSVKGLKAGLTYRYRIKTRKKVDGKIYYSKYSAIIEAKVPKAQKKGKSTLKKFLETALQPVGKTMYVWGGGWNEEDTGAGTDARTIGVSPEWERFFNKQNSSYDYNQTRYQIRDGLDCSGYVGWCIYNIMNTSSGKEGYVMKAEEMASDFASRGWGQYVGRFSVKDYQPGDIMSSSCSDCGHVWIVVGACQDGSVVLVHSSPQGVQINGTVDRYGNTSSEAVNLAAYYMKNYFPKWYKKYPNCMRGESYLSHYAQMRWDVSGSSVMTDPQGYRNKSAAQILQDLLE